MSDNPPIEPLDYLHGVKVVDIGDLRVARGMSRRPVSLCSHRQLRYDERERRVWCADCESDVEPFDAFTGIVQRFAGAAKDIARRQDAVKAAEETALFSRAAKAIDEIWRRKKVVPACPHCRRGILPEDIANGIGKVSAELERQRRMKS